MEKSMAMRSLFRALSRRSFGISSSGSAPAVNQLRRHLHLHHPSVATFSPSSDLLPAFTARIGGVRYFSEDVAHMPAVKDSEIEHAFKDLMATYWEELPASVVRSVKKALSKSTEDKAGQEALANVLRSAEAVEEFSGILTSLKMAMDDNIGMSGDDVKAMPDHFVKALETIYKRYDAYLEAFGPDELYLKKKVEYELGTKMIHLKMRCSGLDSKWGKVTVLGTSGLAGSYVEQRA